MSQLNLPVEEYTTPNPLTASENTHVDELAKLMRENGVRHIPILRDSKVVGIVSERDLRIVSCLNPREKSLVQARDIMAVDPVTVRSEDSLDQVAFAMSQNKIGSVIVNDENDQFLGIFTATDALNALIEITRSSQQEL